tara:strand:- start:1004 stop:3370 length:2367 start_codon:yes stop_codon:yes gene_type:complete
MAQYFEEHAVAFVEQLTGNKDSVCHFQLFYDPKDGSKRRDLARDFAGSLKQAKPTIERAEANLQGVYVCLNETDRKGRETHNITKIRACFADFDNQAEPNWPLPPHFVTKRDDTHGHAFWLVDDIEVDEFMYVQRQIAMSCQTDLQVIDPARVVRLPGTLHLKDPQHPKVYSLVKVNAIGRKYTKQELINGFVLTEQQQLDYRKWCDSRESLGNGTGFEDNQLYRDKYVKFLTEHAEPAIEGSGSATLIRVTSYAHDHGLPLEVAQDLAWEHYNPRCIPPWSEAERGSFDAIIERAYKYARNEPGCRTAQAAFIDAPEIPPAPKRKVIDIVRTGDRWPKDVGETNWPLMTAKSAHYELAQCFDAMLYDGTNIVRCNKIFYEYSGKSWSVISDDVIKAKIQRMLAKFKPSDTLVRGVLNSLCDLCNVSRVENGIWLSDGKPTDNIVCFNNGLVDLSENKAVMVDHTPNFFCFNELEYDYEPGANCPMWLETLAEIFQHDEVLITQLQEWFGYCMASDNSFEKFALFIGKSRAGKGTVTEMLRNVVGTANIAAPSLSKLTSDSTLAGMVTASVALIPDAHSIHSSKRDDVLSNFKAITGNDPLGYHVMYKGSENTVFKTRFVLSTNNMPEFIDASGALVNRMLVFPFRTSFAGRENFGLKKKLLSEVSGVAQWALEGLRRLRANGRFTEASTGIAERENIKEEMNPIARFIDNVCVVDANAFVSTDRLYDTYLLWCRQRKVGNPLSQNKLTRLLNASDLPIRQGRKRVDGDREYGFSGLNVVQFPAVGDA